MRGSAAEARLPHKQKVGGSIPSPAKHSKLKKNMPKKLFVFDVESIGLYGEGYAVAGGIYTRDGAESEFIFAIDPAFAKGENTDRECSAGGCE